MGDYQVTLMFAETYWSQVGQRIFSLAINDNTILTDFDILSKAGGANRALPLTFQAHVNGSTNNTIVIAADPSWGLAVWNGGLPGTWTQVVQDFGEGIVNVVLTDQESDQSGLLGDALGSDRLLGQQWP